MGAVFALFVAFYYWFVVNKSNNVFTQYFENLGVSHFMVTFIGVNVTFFPMHFLGISGMPRRISEYPITFHGWNLVATAGAICSLIGVFILFIILHHYYVNSYTRLLHSFYNTYYLMGFFYNKKNVFNKLNFIIKDSFYKNNLNLLLNKSFSFNLLNKNYFIFSSSIYNKLLINYYLVESTLIQRIYFYIYIFFVKFSSLFNINYYYLFSNLKKRIVNIFFFENRKFKY